MPISWWLHHAFTPATETSRVIKKKILLRILLLPWILLAVPLMAMLLKIKGWAWGPFDFIAAWVLMSGAGFAYAWITRRTIHLAYQLATGLALATGFLLVWINGAVGLIGSEDNPANAMYGGVLLIGLIGAGLARLEPYGMAGTLFAMSLAQLLVPVIALIFWRPDFSPGVLPVFGLNAGFACLFAGSALLFRHAARQPRPVVAERPIDDNKTRVSS
jgi:hypothetical protein